MIRIIIIVTLMSSLKKSQDHAEHVVLNQFAASLLHFLSKALRGSQECHNISIEQRIIRGEGHMRSCRHFLDRSRTEMNNPSRHASSTDNTGLCVRRRFEPKTITASDCAKEMTRTD